MSDILKERENGARLTEDPRLDILRDENGELKLTEQQADAVLSSGKLLVSAAAGAGKTSTLVKRILLTVSEGTATLRDMLVCVYNDSAQAELRQRLHTELIRCAIKERDFLRRARLLRAIDDLPFCRISTIHAFCSSLIKENFEKLGISPMFDIADDARLAALMNDAMDEVFDAYAAEGDEDFGTLVEIFAQKRNEDGLKKYVTKLRDRLVQHEDRENFVRGMCTDFDNSPLHGELLDHYRKLLREALGIMSPLLIRVCNTAELVTRGMHERMRQAVEAVEKLLTADSFYKLCEEAKRTPEFVKTKSSRGLEDGSLARSDFYLAKNCSTDVENILATLSGVYDKWEEFRLYHAQNVRFTSKLIELTERVERTFDRMKSEQNVLGYQDLLILAARLLKEDPEAGRDFKAVFVDEYQDVDPLQESIFERLIGDECFMVGDVKQSIYGFRLADPSILMHRKKAFEDGEGKVIDFNCNFRSDPEILGFVNSVFDSVMTEDIADVDYRHDGAFDVLAAKAVAQRRGTAPAPCDNMPPEEEDGSGVGSRVRICLFKSEGRGSSDSSAKGGLYDITAEERGAYDEGPMSVEDKQARYILKQINRLVGHALKADSQDGATIDYGDIAILSRQGVQHSKTLRRVVETLKAAGIPLDETNVGGEASEAERELILMLKALDNPRQDIPFAGYLLSYFGGYDEQELADISAYAGETFYDRFVAAGEGGGKLASKISATLATLDEYRLKAGFKSVRELMQSIVADYMYDAYMHSKGEGNLVELKNFMAATDEISLGKFLKNYTAQDNGAVGASANSIRVSTIHKFKGLESPVVFLVDFTGAIKDVDGELYVGRDGYLGMKYYNLQNKTYRETFSRFAVKTLEKAKAVKDEMRLMYVALTRAKQLMYITEGLPKEYEFGTDPCIDGISSARDFLSLAKLRGSLNKDPHPIEMELEPDVTLHAPVMNYKGDDELKQKVIEARGTQYAHKEATALSMKYSVSQLGAAYEPQTAYPFADDGQQAKIGTAYHRVMQRVDFATDTFDGVVRELERMVADGYITEEEKGYVKPEDILACLSSDLMKMAREAEARGECDREKAFMMLKPAKDVGLGQSEDKVLVQGVIDLYIRGQKRVIADFKTGYLDEDHVPERYKRQLYLYKTAVETADNAKVDEIYLYSFKSGKTVSLQA